MCVTSDLWPDKSDTLRRLIFARLTLAWIYFRGCKYCHFSRGFIFADGEDLIISRGLIFAVARNVMFISSIIIAWIKQTFAKLPKMYQVNQYNLPLFVIQSVKKHNYSF